MAHFVHLTFCFGRARLTEHSPLFEAFIVGGVC